MCGVCGRPATGWPERVAPLGPGGTVARHRAVRRLLAGTRTAARPWPGGGWQFTDRAGRLRYCPGLEALWAAVGSAAGPVVVPDPRDEDGVHTLPGPDTGTADPHALVVWTAAALHAGPAAPWLVVRAAGWRMAAGRVDGAPGRAPRVTVGRCAGAGLTVEAPGGARSLAEQLAAHLAELSVRPPSGTF